MTFNGIQLCFMLIKNQNIFNNIEELFYTNIDLCIAHRDINTKYFAKGDV